MEHIDRDKNGCATILFATTRERVHYLPFSATIAICQNTTMENHLCMKIKITFEFLTFEIQIFQTTSDRETTKTKVVDFEKLCNS